MSTRVLASVVRQVLDLPAEPLAAVIGSWPQPRSGERAGIRRGRPMEHPGGLSSPGLGGDRLTLVDAHRLGRG